jgi:hypothetical protein
MAGRAGLVAMVLLASHLAVPVALAAAWAADQTGDALGPYLERLRLTRLLAEHLEREITAATLPEDRARLVERLADVYPELLEREEDAARRDELVARSSAFLARESPKQADGLRLALLRARYRASSRVAEDFRAAMGDEVKVADARESLGTIGTEAAELRKRFEIRLRDLERRGERTDGLAGERVQDRADVVRGQVQEAMGLEAWALYYRSILTGDRKLAEQAQPIFARLLETGQEYPSPDDVSLDLRSNEFFANTILGMALAKSRTESFAAASDWLALLDVQQAPDGIRRQLPAWRLVAAIERSEWTAGRDIVKAFTPDAPSAWLRIAAVGGLRDGGGSREAVAMAREAIASLAARRELGQIADLARRFGEEAIGTRGFASKYVRGVLAYETGRREGEAKNVTASLSAYDEAARQLEQALQEPDVSEFAAASLACRSLAGWSRFERGEFEAARVLFAAVTEASEGRDEESEWMALVCVEKLMGKASAGSEAHVALAKELRQRVDAFIGHHPASARVPQVLLRRTTLVEIPRRDDLERLVTGAGATDEVKRQALNSYYRLYRASSGTERASVGKRFLELSRSMAPSGGPDGTYEGLPGSSLTVTRQALEIALSPEVADVAYGAALIDRIDELVKAKLLDPKPVSAELSVRRVQLALARGDLVPALARLADLEAEKGDEARRSADVARRHVFRFASAKLREVAIGATPTADRGAIIDATLRTGERILENAVATSGSLEAALAENAMESVAVTTLQAAAEASQGGGDREIALRGLTLAKALLAKRAKDPLLLELTATLAASVADNELALDSLRLLIAGSSERSDRWFRAKVTFLELLARIDAGRAKAVLQQHRQLHPDLGPEPWAGRLRELERTLIGVEAKPEASETPAPAAPATGGKEASP